MVNNTASLVLIMMRWAELTPLPFDVCSQVWDSFL